MTLKPEQYFEVFNHFLVTGDPIQISSYADNVEVFGSASLGDGRVYFGRKAPEKFRQVISAVAEEAKPAKVRLRHAHIVNSHASFFLDITRGGKKHTSVLSVSTRNGVLTEFHEAKVSL
ncbi:MAG: hypothetical protein WA989_06465 [Henriciella sp.]|uniref:hypothetical protein n=1 Tax=Henriciella sp. TaxID=1968823 RepID=UPI003C720E45